ncbi:MAG: TPM domain-containing protein [Lachnospiraceae bacterium]|nr:TPM domain-containing protein [Lachnospiraceae bacterium]
MHRILQVEDRIKEFYKGIFCCSVMMFIIMLVVILGVLPVSAAENIQYTRVAEYEDYIICSNDINGYEILIDDKAGLLSDEEEDALIQYMVNCSENGFVLLVTENNNKYGSAYSYARNYYDSMIPEESGVLFLIDMDTRQLLFYSEGDYHYELSDSTLDIIGDNIYRYATDEKYYDCAKEGFIEISDVLNGKRIAAPMKYISNVCLAILLALIINYFFVRVVSGKNKASGSEILRNIESRFKFTNPSVRFMYQDKTYSPRSSGSGGGSSGGGGGGGSSSGGHSF